MEALTAYDFQLLDAIAQIRNPFLDFLMPLITLLGENGIFVIVLSITLACIPKTRKAGVTMMIALAIGFIVCNLMIKPLVARIRPYDINTTVELLMPRLYDFSFPSGHSSACFSVAVALSYYYRRAEWVFYLLAAAVGFSRLYLYMHYPTDVLAGMLFGILSGFAGIVLARLLIKRFPLIFEPKKGLNR